jgi:hypothetical protein
MVGGDHIGHGSPGIPGDALAGASQKKGRFRHEFLLQRALRRLDQGDDTDCMGQTESPLL